MNLRLNSLTALGLMSLVTATFGRSISAVHFQNANTIKVDGSSTFFAITEATAEEFQKFQGVCLKFCGWVLRFFSLLVSFISLISESDRQSTN